MGVAGGGDPAGRPQRLRDHPWADRVEIVAGDASASDDISAALEDVDVAYYLLHSLVEGRGFVDLEASMASTFADAAVAQGVGKDDDDIGLLRSGGKVQEEGKCER